MEPREKYPRSLHSPISLGTTSDDRFIPEGYVEVFSKFSGLIITQKLDGENQCFKKEGLFARSHTAPTTHPWSKPLMQRWELIKNDLGSLQLFGENMYGEHSIAYKGLESFFYVFGVRDGETWLSWEEVKFYADLFDFPTVPTIEVKTPLSSLLGTHKDENVIFNNWLTANLGMTWLDYVNTSGALGGYDPLTGAECCEGFVIRDVGAYKLNAGHLPVQDNEFDSLVKIVREKHVKTDVHWTKTWRPATLVGGEKYGWYGYNT
jgi:hypothetical protein